jgi:hypothetical protein
MDKTNESDLKFSSKNRTFQPVVKVGDHTLLFLDKDIVARLNIKEGECIEQFLTDDGSIILRVKKIPEGLSKFIKCIGYKIRRIY